MLKEAMQSNLKRPEGIVHDHVPISPTVNNDNAEGHCFRRREQIEEGRRHWEFFCLIVNSVYTDKKHLLRSKHTHIIGYGWVCVTGRKLHKA